MKKIISLFQRNYDGDRLVRDEIVPGAEWVVNGEGLATEKVDGTSCLWKGGALWKRHDVKKGKTPPAGWVAAQEPDPVTGHHPGWIMVGDGPEDRWHIEALADSGPLLEGTYELVGPKVQGNPYSLEKHQFEPHGARPLFDCPRNFAGILDYLTARPHLEGIVWHHPDGRMVKIKRRDFGLKWNGR